jgi:hypothetical protein
MTARPSFAGILIFFLFLLIAEVIPGNGVTGTIQTPADVGED